MNNDQVNDIIDKVDNWFERLHNHTDEVTAKLKDSQEVTIGAGGNLFEVIAAVFKGVFDAIYDIIYFVINAWPLWVGVGLIILIVEVKKWNRERNLTRSLSRSERLLKLKEEAERRRQQREAEHKRKLMEAEEEHLKKLHQAEEKHAKKLKVIKNPRTGKKRKKPTKPKMEAPKVEEVSVRKVISSIKHL